MSIYHSGTLGTGSASWVSDRHRNQSPWVAYYTPAHCSRQHIEKQGRFCADNGPPSQGYGFPVVMYGCESWTIKKAER